MPNVQAQPYSNRDAISPPTESEIRFLALRVYEIVSGVRPVEQLARWALPHVLTRLSLLRNLHKEKNHLYGTVHRIVPIPGKVVISKTSSRRIFCVVVLHSKPRAIAVLMTFSAYHVGWRANEINLL